MAQITREARRRESRASRETESTNRHGLYSTFYEAMDTDFQIRIEPADEAESNFGSLSPLSSSLSLAPVSAHIFISVSVGFDYLGCGTYVHSVLVLVCRIKTMVGWLSTLRVLTGQRLIENKNIGARRGRGEPYWGERHENNNIPRNCHNGMQSLVESGWSVRRCPPISSHVSSLNLTYKWGMTTCAALVSSSPSPSHSCMRPPLVETHSPAQCLRSYLNKLGVADFDPDKRRVHAVPRVRCREIGNAMLRRGHSVVQR